MVILMTTHPLYVETSPARGVARYRQVADVLREQIRRGIYPPGSQIKTEHELSNEFSVSRTTIRQAVAELVNDKVLVRRQGRGTFVLEPPPTAGLAFSGSLDDLTSTSRRFRVVTAEIVHGEAPPRIGALLGKDPSELTHILRDRHFDGAPLARTENYLPREIGEQLNPGMLRTGSLLEILADKFDIRFTRAKQAITAAMAEPSVAAALEIAVGAPVLDVERLMFTDDGPPFEVVRSLYPGGRYVIEAELVGTQRALFSEFA
jgi:GntR family transcriptional regulator